MGKNLKLPLPCAIKRGMKKAVIIAIAGAILVGIIMNLLVMKERAALIEAITMAQAGKIEEALIVLDSFSNSLFFKETARDSILHISFLDISARRRTGDAEDCEKAIDRYRGRYPFLSGELDYAEALVIEDLMKSGKTVEVEARRRKAEDILNRHSSEKRFLKRLSSFVKTPAR
jgi:hypothetical protein